MYEYFLNAIKAKGLSVADVVRGTGIAKSTMSEWKSGRSTPKADKMQKIAEFLDVSVEYLLTGRNEPVFVMPDYDPKEHELIEKFGVLNDEQKDIILSVIRQFTPAQNSNSTMNVLIETDRNALREDRRMKQRLLAYAKAMQDFIRPIDVNVETSKPDTSKDETSEMVNDNEKKLEDTAYDLFNNIVNGSYLVEYSFKANTGGK